MNYISALSTETATPWAGLAVPGDTDNQVELLLGDTHYKLEILNRDAADPALLPLRDSATTVHLSPNAAITKSDLVMADEETPLLHDAQSEKAGARTKLNRPHILRRLVKGVISAVRAVVSAMLTPGAFIVDCFYDEQGQFSSALPLKRISMVLRWSQSEPSPQPPIAFPASAEKTMDIQPRIAQRRSSEPESDQRQALASRPTLMERRSSRTKSDQDSPSRHTRSKSVPSSTAEVREPTTPKRSIRISVLNEDALLQRRLDRQKRDSVGSDTDTHLSPNARLVAKSIKSPTSPASSMGLTRYPRALAPPRPLVPKRQPSYTYTSAPSNSGSQKTLIIDLDETLIHSMSKGGRMSTGHMVEVKLQNPVGVEGASIGLQVPILYYVHKRPHCDEFLRKASGMVN